MHFIRRSFIGLFLLAATLGLLALAAGTVADAFRARMADDGPARAARERVLAVNVVPFDAETIAPDLVAYGEIRSIRTLEVRAQASGTIVELGDNMREGGRVAAGQLLFRVDPTDALTAREVAQTDLQDATAEVREARRAVELAGEEVGAAEDQAALRGRALERQQNLSDRGVGTEASVEEAGLAASSARQAVLARRQVLASAEARVNSAATARNRAQIALDEAERRVADTGVHAEFDGILDTVGVVKGRLVGANEKVADLIDPATLEVAFRLSTPEYARLLDATGALSGADLMVSLDVTGMTLESPGTISRDSASVGEGQSGRVVFASLDGGAGFRPGDFVTVTVAEPPLDRVARLPASAVNSAGELLLVGVDERIEIATVEILRRQGDDVLVRGDGLDGRQVVAERSPLLGRGIKVRPIAPVADAGEEVVDLPAMIELTEERRARLIAFVQGNAGMPEAARERVLAQLNAASVPARTVERIESRMGG